MVLSGNTRRNMESSEFKIKCLTFCIRLEKIIEIKEFKAQKNLDILKCLNINK